MHEPVLLREVIEGLRVRRGGVYVDATLGSGGHALALLEAIGPEGRVLGIDRDPHALARVRERLGARAAQCALARGNYADLAAMAAGAGVSAVDGVLIDCGVSSEQLETGERGFSFMIDGPLDMRMDPSESPSARDVVNELPERDLVFVLRMLGEEPAARRIARAIVEARAAGPIATTGQLAAVVERAVGGRRGRQHPATRSFQALRMRVNRELESLESGLEAGLRLLGPGGRMAVISFHSLEDRLVKQNFRENALAGRYEIVTRKPERADGQERKENPRSRSAKLRVARRIV